VTEVDRDHRRKKIKKNEDEGKKCWKRRRPGEPWGGAFDEHVDSFEPGVDNSWS